MGDKKSAVSVVVVVLLIVVGNYLSIHSLITQLINQLWWGFNDLADKRYPSPQRGAAAIR